MKFIQVAFLFMFVMLVANVEGAKNYVKYAARRGGGDECKTNADCPPNYFCVMMNGRRKCVTN